MVILTALTGQIGKPGAALGHPGGGQGYGAALAAWPLPEDMVPADIPVRADRFADADAACMSSYRSATPCSSTTRT